MAWNDLASNQMVSFTDAQGGGFTLNAGQVGVTSSQCMDKTAALAKYKLVTSNMSSYASNQLVPKSSWVALSTTPSFISAGGIGASSTETTLNVPYPSTVNSGDFILLLVIYETLTGITVPTGFSNAGIGSTNINSQSYRMYYKFANGTEGGTTVAVTTASATVKYGIIMQYRNVNTGTPYGSTNYTDYTTLTSLMTGNGVASTISNSLGVTLWMYQGSLSVNLSSGFPPWVYAGGGATTAGTGHTVLSAYQELPTVGSTGGSVAVSFSSSTTYGKVINIVLRPV
jgi:hypothetical protein